MNDEEIQKFIENLKFKRKIINASLVIIIIWLAAVFYYHNFAGPQLDQLILQ